MAMATAISNGISKRHGCSYFSAHVYQAISVNAFEACERYHTIGTLLH